MGKAYKCDGCGQLIEHGESLEESSTSTLGGKQFVMWLGIAFADETDPDLCLTCKKLLVTEFVAHIHGRINL